MTSRKMGRTVLWVEVTHRLSASHKARCTATTEEMFAVIVTSKQCRLQHLSKPWRCPYAAAAASGAVKAARWLEFLRAVL